MGAQMLALFFVGMYRTVWRILGFAEILIVAKGTLLGMFTAELVILHLYRFESYSRALFAIYAVLLAIMLTASHTFFALMNELLDRSRKPAPSVETASAERHLGDRQLAIVSSRWFRKSAAPSAKSPDSE